MKKQFILLIAIFLIFVAGCGTSITEANLDSVKVEQYTESRRNVDQDIIVTLSYPVLSAEGNDAAAQKVINQLNDQFAQDASHFAEQVTGTGASKYEALVQYNQEGMLSVVTSETFNEGTYRQCAATYNLHTGDKMTLGEVLQMKEDEAEALVVQQFGGVVQTDPATFNSDAAEYIASNLDRLQFYREDMGLAVFFQPGEIAPESSGVLEIVIQ